MGRSKLRLELLGTAKARRKTYETRNKGLEKKARELSTLCGVDVCFISYPPPLKSEEIRPFVWSNDPSRVANMIESHMLSGLGGECSRSRTCDLAWFYKDQTRKVEEEVEKLRDKNREAKYPNWDQRYDSMSPEELKSLTVVLTDKIAAAKVRSGLLKERNIKYMESNTCTNPVTQENSGTSNMMFEQQHPLPYFDAQTYNLEYWRRMLAAAAMTMDITNPVTQENSGSSNMMFEQQHPLPYFDAQTLEYWRRMLASAAMTMDIAAPRSVGIDPALNHSDNGIINVNQMIYNLETASDQKQQHAVGYGPIVINNPGDYFPQVDAAYGQGLMANNPTDFYYPDMDASYGENDSFKQWSF